MITDRNPNKFIPIITPYNGTDTLPYESSIRNAFISDVRSRLMPLKPILSPNLNQQEKILALVRQKRLERLNALQVVEDAEYEEENSETEEKEEEINLSDIGKDVIMMENTQTLTKKQKKVYDIIISAFEEKKMSSSAIYCALQNIPYIDIIGDVIVIYTKYIDMFDKLEIPCVNILLALQEGFKNDDLKVKFIPCKIQTIADYFSKKK